MIQLICHDRRGNNIIVKCDPKSTIAEFKKLIAIQTGTPWEKMVLRRWYTIFEDHMKLEDYLIADQIQDGVTLELYNRKSF